MPGGPLKTATSPTRSTERQKGKDCVCHGRVLSAAGERETGGGGWPAGLGLGTRAWAAPFSPLGVSAQDCRPTASIDLGAPKKCQRVGGFSHRGSVNREGPLSLVLCDPHSTPWFSQRQNSVPLPPPPPGPPPAPPPPSPSPKLISFPKKENPSGI